jgi:hypothetical protein
MLTFKVFDKVSINSVNQLLTVLRSMHIDVCYRSMTKFTSRLRSRLRSEIVAKPAGRVVVTTRWRVELQNRILVTQVRARPRDRPFSASEEPINVTAGLRQ